MMNSSLEQEKGQVLLYQMAELFGRYNSMLYKHLKAVFEGGELSCEATVAKYATVQVEVKL